eukprot:476456-Hanusia_phi.AAC.2
MDPISRGDGAPASNCKVASNVSRAWSWEVEASRSLLGFNILEQNFRSGFLQLQDLNIVPLQSHVSTEIQGSGIEAVLTKPEWLRRKLPATTSGRERRNFRHGHAKHNSRQRMRQRLLPMLALPSSRESNRRSVPEV